MYVVEFKIMFKGFFLGFFFGVGVGGRGVGVRGLIIKRKNYI